MEFNTLPTLSDISHSLCDKHGAEKMYINGKCGICEDEKNHLKNNKIITQLHQKIRENSGIPMRYLPSTFENYLINNNYQKQIVDKLKLFEFNKNLLFLGKTGTGKTHLACALLNKYIKNITFTDNEIETLKNRSMLTAPVSYVKFYYLLHLKINENKFYKKLINQKFLIIDEIGTNESINKSNLLFEIIDERYDNLQSTMLISNLTVDNFKEFLSAPIYSRIKENYIIFDANWEDFRTNTKNI